MGRTGEPYRRPKVRLNYNHAAMWVNHPRVAVFEREDTKGSQNQHVAGDHRREAVVLNRWAIAASVR